MKMLKSINNALILISKFLCLLGGIMLIAMMLITSVDVGLRTFLHSAFNGASVIVRNLLVVAMFLGLPYVTFVAGHTRSEFLYARASSKTKLILDLIAEGIGTVQGSCASSGEYDVCLNMIGHKMVDADSIISKVVPLAQGGEWFDRLHDAEPGLIKVVLEP